MATQGLDGLATLIEQLQLPRTYLAQTTKYLRPLADKLIAKPGVIGIAGPQGCGKSTTAKLLKHLIEDASNLRCIIISLDDFYLSTSRRAQLAHSIHPLLKTRGVPGTHNVQQAIQVLRALKDGQQCTPPRFNKATDEPEPAHSLSTANGAYDVILFEGWCVNAIVQSNASLGKAINALETEKDNDKRWRTYVNQQLSKEYAALYKLLEQFIFFEIASFDNVFAWRNEQERKLIASNEGLAAQGLMDNSQLRVFIQHFERITRWMQQEAPSRADHVIKLNKQQLITSIKTSQ